MYIKYNLKNLTLSLLRATIFKKDITINIKCVVFKNF